MIHYYFASSSLPFISYGFFRIEITFILHSFLCPLRRVDFLSFGNFFHLCLEDEPCHTPLKSRCLIQAQIPSFSWLTSNLILRPNSCPEIVDDGCEVAHWPCDWFRLRAMVRDLSQFRDFCMEEWSEDVLNTVVVDSGPQPHDGSVAVTSSDDIWGNKKIILGGLVHYRRWPYLFKGKTSLYGDDLFTLPESRGQGIATLLINTLSELVKKEGLGALRWTSESDNTTARRLYDSFGTVISRVTYEMVPGSNNSSFAKLHSSNGYKELHKEK